ncbi:MAG: UDP-forming cellulose synthase catalytic subunit [Nitrospinae bacterium]|nr:UDP-forming cellulose synthase catalytic subunit [Nitrospinota bacterium]
MSTKKLTVQLTVFFAAASIFSYSLYATEQYLDFNFKLAIGWVSFGLIYLLYKHNTKRRDKQDHATVLRIVFILLSAFLSIRYLLWRTFETLYYTGPFDFIALTLLYMAECHAISLHIFSIFININPLKRKLLKAPLEGAELPTVDVFVPTYTEADDIIKITVTAATQMKYPADKLRVHIIDDGSTIARRNNPKTSADAWERYYTMRRIADELGVNYITRETNSHAKAGNINHALTKTGAELVLVLDCDHVPTQDMLENTVGVFMKDEKVFLVQTPHFFINPTPVEKQLEGVAEVSVENDMFFRLIHSGLDFWNSSYFCGSAAVLRRKHLNEIGGLSTKTITEDAETSLLLHEKGYQSVYVNHPMVCGLSPETFSDYVIQRTRWAQGMIQMFIMMNVLTLKGLSAAQKLCYFNMSFFWFFGVARFIFYVTPPLYLLFGLKVYHASMGQIISYAVPYVFSTILVMDYLYGKVRKPFFSEIYESVQALFLIPAILSVLINPRHPTFKITPKGRTIEEKYLNPLAAPFFIVVAINLISIPFAVYTWFEFPLFRSVVVVTSVWCLFNIFLALVSLGAFWEKKQVRRYHRIKASGEASIFFPRMNQTLRADVIDISLTGISVEVAAPFEVIRNEDMVITVWDSYGASYVFNTQRRRAWPRRGKLLCGTEIINSKQSFASAVQYVYGDSQRWLDDWNKKSASSGTGRLLWGFLVLGINAEKEIIVSMYKWALAALSGKFASLLYLKNLKTAE